MSSSVDKVDPVEIGNRAIRVIGDGTTLGESCSLVKSVIPQLEGIPNYRHFSVVCDELRRRGLIEVDGGIGNTQAKLTYRGWEHYNNLGSGEAQGTTAFLAHQFGVPDISTAVEKFAEVCSACGYRPVDLERVEHLKAGGINNRIELEIKLSKFVIADLTENNNGAYWEAGFAAGLGRKVIYTCRQDFFDTAKTHFDVNHHMTILWQPDNLADAEEKLEACIRNTFADDHTVSVL